MSTAQSKVTIEDFLARLEGVRQTGERQWEARCPAHDDRNASLSVSNGDDGKILIHCHRGCATASIVHETHLTMFELFPPKERWEDRITHTYDYHDADGNLVYQVVRLRDPKEFRQRKANGEWKMQGVQRVLYRLPEVLAADTVLIVEGEKSVDRLREAGFVATCNPGGAASYTKAGQPNAKWKPWYNDSLAGKHIIIFPDLDKPDKNGQRAGSVHALLVANELRGRAASIKIVELPISEGQDIDNWWATGKTADDLRAVIDATPEWTDESTLDRFANEPAKSAEEQAAASAGGRLQIETTLDEHVENQKSLEGLSKDPDLYCRGGDIVAVNIDNTTGDEIPRMMRLSKPTVRDRLSANCYYYHIKTIQTPEGEVEQEVQDPVPGTAVSAIFERGYFDDYLRPLRGVATTQFLRPDGSLVTEPGYDFETGFLYYPIGEQPKIPENPTHKDVSAALDALLGVVRDFPMDALEDRSAWLALLLTIVGRTTYSGPAPMTLIDANVRGAGKGLLADVASLIALGRPASVTSPPEDDAEFRKRITTLVMSGDPLILIDNVAGMLGCASLDAVLTSTVWKDRILGKNEQCELPMLATWMATGNNVQIRADTARRLLQIRLVSPEERPETRDDFKHRDLRQFVRDNRPKLYGAALTILRAWFVAGKPTRNMKPLGSFEGWSGVVREAVAFCGLCDPALTQERLIETSDTEAGALAAIIESWPELVYYYSGDREAMCSCTTREIIEAIKQQPDRLPNLTSAVEMMTGQSVAKITTRSLGRHLTKYTMRVVGRKQIMSVMDRTKIKRWMVRDI